MPGENGGLRVLVVDDHDVVQWGFRLLLERQSWVERCLAASDGAEAVEVCTKVKPQVALVDMLLGAESGADVCEEIRKASPSTRVLLISGAGVVSPNVARAAGASGFISKDWSAVDVVKAVRMVSLGTEVFADQAPLDSPLSEREQEVLSLIATGSTNKEIAGQLHLSPHTVKEHTSAIYRKLGVRNRAEATRQAQRLKILV
jgi:DNA-binding NarL/FixJ family response regulator